MLGERKKTWGSRTSPSNLLKSRVHRCMVRGIAILKPALETSRETFVMACFTVLSPFAQLTVSEQKI